MKNKTEIEIVNEKVSDAIKSLTKKHSAHDSIVKIIQKNQSNFYHWQNLERLMDSPMIENDEAAFNYLKSNFNEGVLKDVLHHFIPIIKENLKNHIDKQIEELKK